MFSLHNTFIGRLLNLLIAESPDFLIQSSDSTLLPCLAWLWGLQAEEEVESEAPRQQVWAFSTENLSVCHMPWFFYYYLSCCWDKIPG